jgi:hypothetical protein
MNFRKNNFFFGFALAVMVTVAAYGAFWLINHFVMKAIVGRAFLQESTLMIVSLGMNIFVLNYFLKFNAIRTGRGMLVFTLLCAAFIIYWYFGAQLGIRSPRIEEVIMPQD